MWVIPTRRASIAFSSDPGPPIMLSAASGWIGTVWASSHQSWSDHSAGPVSCGASARLSLGRPIRRSARRLKRSGGRTPRRSASSWIRFSASRVSAQVARPMFMQVQENPSARARSRHSRSEATPLASQKSERRRSRPAARDRPSATASRPSGRSAGSSAVRSTSMSLTRPSITRP
jgi:hypothetical protein